MQNGLTDSGSKFLYEQEAMDRALKEVRDQIWKDQYERTLTTYDRKNY